MKIANKREGRTKQLEETMRKKVKIQKKRTN